MNDKDFLEKLTYIENVNQTITDPFLKDLSTVTINKNYYPNAYINKNKDLLHDNSLSVKDYFPCFIEVYYAGSKSYTIPILFQQSFEESSGASYAKESPIGSKVPIVAFSHSDPSTLSISFYALSDYLPTVVDKTYNNKTYTKLKDYIDDIKRMTKPIYSDNIVKSPSVKIIYSNLVYEGVCDSVNVSYQNILGNKSLVKADISCSFTVTGGV